MTSHLRFASSLLVFTFVCSAPLLAHAQEDEATEEEGPAPVASTDPPLKSLAIELNPLSLFIGRLSANVEYMPAVHHAVVVNPYYVSVNADVTVGVDGDAETYEDNFSGGGVELGYRMYTGSKGPNGFFVGPSLLLGLYNSEDSDFTDTEGRTFTSYGFAVDIGGQGVIGPGIVLGGGFGLQYTKVSGDAPGFDLPLTAEILVGGGVRPRFLLSVGYAFSP